MLTQGDPLAIEAKLVDGKVMLQRCRGKDGLVPISHATLKAGRASVNPFLHANGVATSLGSIRNYKEVAKSIRALENGGVALSDDIKAFLEDYDPEDEEEDDLAQPQTQYRDIDDQGGDSSNLSGSDGSNGVERLERRSSRLKARVLNPKS